jgi:hypothetical protein
MPGTKKSGREISVYLTFQRLEQIERIKGRYLTTSKFIDWCLQQVLDGKIEKIPPGATVSSPAPSGADSSFSNNTANTPVEEVAAGVS